MTAIISLTLLLVSAIVSFIKSNNLRIQLIYVVIASFSIGVFTSIILLNYSSKAALVWPVLFFLHVINKAKELLKNLPEA